MYTKGLIILCLGCNQTNQTGSETPQSEEVNTEVSTAPAVDPSTVTSTNTISTNSETMLITFDDAPTGKLPQGWTTHKTGQGNTIRWEVVEDAGNKVFAQLTDNNPNNHFNVATLEDVNAKNVTLETRFKSIKGKIDQGGGFVWRFKDANNYYIVRANSLEDNVVLYKVENGKRTDLPLVGKGRTYGANVKVPINSWHTIKLEAKDNLFTVFINGKELFQVEDQTFTSAGKVGLWSKADAVTYFDDLQITIKD